MNIAKYKCINYAEIPNANVLTDMELVRVQMGDFLDTAVSVKGSDFLTVNDFCTAINAAANAAISGSIGNVASDAALTALAVSNTVGVALTTFRDTTNKILTSAESGYIPADNGFNNGQPYPIVLAFTYDGGSEAYLVYSLMGIGFNAAAVAQAQAAAAAAENSATEAENSAIAAAAAAVGAEEVGEWFRESVPGQELRTGFFGNKPFP